MSDEEKKETPKEEKAEKQEKPAKTEAPAEKPAKAEAHEKPAKAEVKEEKPAEGAGEKKGKKVSQMSLSEVEAELKIVKEKMGGFQSAHARNLLARRDCLSKN